MIDFTKEGRVGDRVKSMRCGKGTIVAIGNRENETYPIVVAHDSGGQSTYTATGKHLEAYSHPSLMFDNGSVTVDQGTPPKHAPEESVSYWRRFYPVTVGRVTTIDKNAQPEKLYCGLTKKQWRRVIEGKFLVGVSDDSFKHAREGMRKATLIDYLKESKYPFEEKYNSRWKYAAIPNTKGILKPHFGGACPTNHDGFIVVKLRDGAWITITLTYRCNVWLWREGDESRTDIMEYIELP